ncbi:MAG: DUF3619 family protein [Burkholderiaceae bacterium]
MTQHIINSAFPDFARAPQAASEALQTRFGLRVAARLSERSFELGADVHERLRFARENALERARAGRALTATSGLGVTRSGAAILGLYGSRWWLRIASVAPLLALVAGLVLIERWQAGHQIAVAAEVDAALLSDVLPPRAYSDAGFAEFLKSPISID